MEKLVTGVAYHGNRILRHVADDMADIARHNMNLVVHTFTHTDWERHLGVMKSIVDLSRENGLDVWIDNWGIGGPPGDVSHFLGEHPEARQVYSDGTPDPVSVCYNSEAFFEFTKRWLEAVRDFGGDKIFWDEPHLKLKKTDDGGERFTCCCPVCRRLFEERFNMPMPNTLTPEVKAFRAWSMENYFNRVCSYSKLLGMENIVCVMLHTLEDTSGIMDIECVDNFGIDPYWFPGSGRDPYDFVYEASRSMLEKTRSCGKQSHVWIQCYKIPAGYEDEIVTATDAAFDAGARTIVDWSFRGADSNTYKAEKCERVWQVMGEAAARVRNRWFDEIRNKKQEKYK